MKDRKTQDFTVQEASAFFRVTPPTIYALINKGQLKSYLVGRSRRITSESVEQVRKAGQ
ncbi:helix-turn-helix domain-containing protein [Marinihelvus fidelis]|nr:helix-turn-helix domain-containing protein [Marinihelvus fidelis]